MRPAGGPGLRAAGGSGLGRRAGAAGWAPGGALWLFRTLLTLAIGLGDGSHSDSLHSLQQMSRLHFGSISYVVDSKRNRALQLQVPQSRELESSTASASGFYSLMLLSAL
jgi:hypothetical protein